MLVCFLFGEGIDYPGIGTFTLKNQVQFKIMPMNIRADMQNENQNRMEMILENLFHYIVQLMLDKEDFNNFL